MNALNTVNPPKNEPIYKYLKGSKERERLYQEYDKMWNTEHKIPLIIGGKEIFTETTQRIVCPHDHKHNLGTYCMAGEKEINMAIEAAMQAKQKWESLDWFERVSVFLKAAELISTKYRYILNASTMIGQSKNIFQAEIDATCELADFFRFNMKSFNQDSTLRDEIKLVDSYIYILNVRFSGKIKFFKKVDESILDVKVPSMILQPVVENSVNYGIRDIEYEGKICLEVDRVPNAIRITIYDNGAGMEQATIDRILSQGIKNGNMDREVSLTKDSNGIGLGNVINRLKLYYETDDIFHIHSDGHNKGTTVTMLIPKEDDLHV